MISYFGSVEHTPPVTRRRAVPAGYGRPDTVHVLFERHYGALMRFLVRNVRNSDEAADIAQDVYVRLVRYNGLNSVDFAQALLFKTATNLLRDRARRRKVRCVEMHYGLEDSMLVSPAASPQDALEAQQVLALTLQVLRGSDAKRRRAFVLHRLDGLTHEQIAAQMGISVSTARRYIDCVLSSCQAALKGSA